MTEWGDLRADVRHTVDNDDNDDNDSKPRLDGVGRLIASWGSWKEYKGGGR